jgi:hypothetical protein
MFGQKFFQPIAGGLLIISNQGAVSGGWRHRFWFVFRSFGIVNFNWLIKIFNAKSLRFISIQKLSFCHQNTKTLNLTKINSFKFSLLCNLESWSFGGIFYF